MKIPDRRNSHRFRFSSAAAPTGRIMIRSYDGKQLVNCYKVISMHVSGSADTPNYVLYGVDRSSFWGENREMLGWYADEESVQKETADILAAIETGKPSYDLKYAAKVKKTFLKRGTGKRGKKGTSHMRVGAVIAAAGTPGGSGLMTNWKIQTEMSC